MFDPLILGFVWFFFTEFYFFIPYIMSLALFFPPVCVGRKELEQDLRFLWFGLQKNHHRSFSCQLSKN